MDNVKRNIKEATIGKNVRIYDFVNIYGCHIGDNTQIGAFVEIQKGAKIGKKCRIQSHTFICDGVTLEDEVFVGHGVIFINDKYPNLTRTVNKEWKKLYVLVKKRAVIGSGAIIMGGVTIGKEAFIGAGAVVTKDVLDGETVVGVPARKVAK